MGVAQPHKPSRNARVPARCACSTLHQVAPNPLPNPCNPAAAVRACSSGLPGAQTAHTTLLCCAVLPLLCPAAMAPCDETSDHMEPMDLAALNRCGAAGQDKFSTAACHHLHSSRHDILPHPRLHPRSSG